VFPVRRKSTAKPLGLINQSHHVELFRLERQKYLIFIRCRKNRDRNTTRGSIVSFSHVGIFILHIAHLMTSLLSWIFPTHRDLDDRDNKKRAVSAGIELDCKLVVPQELVGLFNCPCRDGFDLRDLAHFLADQISQELFNKHFLFRIDRNPILGKTEDFLCLCHGRSHDCWY